MAGGAAKLALKLKPPVLAATGAGLPNPKEGCEVAAAGPKLNAPFEEPGVAPKLKVCCEAADAPAMCSKGLEPAATVERPGVV